MPNLDHDTMSALASYPRSRDGQPVPASRTGNIYQNACWCWALSGGTLRDSAATSYRFIQNHIIQMSDAGTYPAGINAAAAANYPGCHAHFTALETMLETYEITRTNLSNHNGFTANELTFLNALVQIMARANGLTIVGNATDDEANIRTTYSLHVRSNDCWSVDHWAIGIQPAGKTRMYVQTVPNCDLMHNCTTVWDEHRAIAHFSLATLLDEQVAALKVVLPYRRPGVLAAAAVAHPLLNRPAHRRLSLS